MHVMHPMHPMHPILPAGTTLAPRIKQVAASGELPSHGLQLVQVLQRRTPDRWLERGELVTDDLGRMLWSALRDGRMGVSFRRQHPIGSYYPDFYCAAARLVIELDGEQHGSDKAVAYDNARTRFLHSKGLRVLRIANWQLKEDFDAVCDGIYRAIQETPTRRASRADLPLTGGGRKK